MKAAVSTRYGPTDVLQLSPAFLLPNLEVNIALFTSWGELFLALWLLMKGVNVEQWEKRARESA
jgi:hypothetical protein